MHLNHRQARWLGFFQEFSFDIVHVPGKKNVSDYLSRVPGIEDFSLDSLCSVYFTCSMQCVDDVADDMGTCINALVSMFEESLFFDRLLAL